MALGDGMVNGAKALGNAGGQAAATLANAVSGATKGKYGFIDEAYGLAQSDPQQALAAIRAARSGGKRDLSGSWRESMMARALQAYLSMIGVGGTPSTNPVARANEGLNAIVGSGSTGQGIGGVLRGAAGQMLNGIDYSGLDNSQILDILGLARGAGTFGYSPMGQYQSQNMLEDLQTQANIHQQQGSVNNLFTDNPNEMKSFQDLLQRYLAMK